MLGKRTIVFALGSLVLLGACGSSGGKSPSASPTTSATPPTTARAAVNYHPRIDPANFSNRITNPYFPLKPGTQFAFDGVRDGRPQHTEVTVTNETKTILGIPVVVVRDVVTNSGALEEKTTDWYAQAKNGDVWYFGEATAEYTNGQISNTQGSWEAGVDNAQPGIIMKANPKVGTSYRQEYRPGVAEDTAKVTTVGMTYKAGGTTYRNVVLTTDRNPLNPDKLDQKYFAPGVGLIYTKKLSAGHSETSTLTKVIR